MPLGVNGQVFALCLGNGLTSMPQYGHPSSKASDCKKLKKVWPADFFFHSLQVPPTTLRENSGSSAKKNIDRFHISTCN